MEAAAFTGALTTGLPSTGQTRLLRLAGDDRLVRAVRGGSDAAFEVLYERHHRSLLAFCRHMLGSHEEAEDAVQTTFLAAYHELRTDDDRPIQLRPWLYTIARHRCLRVLRARRPRADVDLEHEPVATDGLGEQVQRRDDLRELLGDLGRLPEDQRAALLLAELHAMSHRDIGAVLDVPTQKVKALVFQARSSLIASRKARAIPCSEVRAQLGELSGGSLRRRELQRHLRECPGCSEFRAQLRRQKALLAAALPVVPTAGLREAVLGTTTGGAGTGGLIAGAAALKGVAAKLALGAGATAALAGGVVAGSGVVSGLDIGHGGATVMAAPGAARLAAAPVARPRGAPTPAAATAASPAAASRPHGRVHTVPAPHRRPHDQHAAKPSTAPTPATPATGQTGRATDHGRAAPKASGPARRGEGNGVRRHGGAKRQGGTRSHGGNGSGGAKRRGGAKGSSGAQSRSGATRGGAKGNGGKASSGARRHGGGKGNTRAQRGSGAKGGGKPSHVSHPHASAPAQPAAPPPAQGSASQAAQSEQHATPRGQTKNAGSDG